MIKTNLTVSILSVENLIEETLLDIKSSNDRSQLIIEPKADKLSVSIIELLDAIDKIERFSTENPISGNMEIEFVQSSVEDIPVMSLDNIPEKVLDDEPPF